MIALIVTVYAVKLGFEARGAPDQNKISEFAAMIGQNYGTMIGFLLTFLGAMWVARKAKVSPIANGVAVGVIVAIGTFGIYYNINFTAIVTFTLTLIAGWLGGLIGRRRSSTEEGRGV